MFSSLPLNRQSIYILSQTSQVGRMECSGQQLSDTCVQCYDCADTHSYERCRWETGLILVEQSLSYVCTSVQFSDIKAPPVLSLHGMNRGCSPDLLMFYHHVFMGNTCWSLRGFKGNSRSGSYALHTVKHARLKPAVLDATSVTLCVKCSPCFVCAGQKIQSSDDKSAYPLPTTFSCLCCAKHRNSEE